jgi:hypothetical protein
MKYKARARVIITKTPESTPLKIKNNLRQSDSRNRISSRLGI